MNNHAYYSITTRQFTLRCGHSDWLEQTQKLYNEVILFYYQLSLELEQQEVKISILNSQQAMRRLEQLTIVGREKNPVPYPLPWKKIPLYFRRAAINGAVTAMHGYLNNKTASIPSKKFHCAVTFYKGAYRELTKDSIQLKVWTGKQWTWLHCRLSGNFIPENAIILSPSVILQESACFLNVPIKEPVKDGRKTKERMQQKTKLCSIQFSNKDTMAIAVILDRNGNQINVHFFRGGAEYVHRCQRLLEKINCSEKKMGLQSKKENSVITHSIKDENIQENKLSEPFNKKYWMKLKHLSEYYSHRISREIIEYCIQQHAEILILPKYDSQYTRYVMYSVGNWSPIHLSIKVRTQIFYKAWRAGIVVLEVDAYGCSNVCSECGAKIQKKDIEFECVNGHRGNRFLNTAKNVGRKFQKSFKECKQMTL